MIKKLLFIIFWVLVVVILLLFSVVFKDTNKAIVAQVEPMKKAISYHKAIRIEEIYVIPGQMVKPGDILVKVTRPDLILDVEKKNNDIERLIINRTLMESKYAGKRQQLVMDKDSKLRRINSEIDQLNIIVSNNQQLSSQFGSLTGYADTIQQYGTSYYQIELVGLKEEIDFVKKQYELESNASKKIFDE